MPLFVYTMTRGGQNKTVELRKSNPQGWLLDAVREAFPEVASRMGAEIMRTRLEPSQRIKQSWSATVFDGDMDLFISVTQKRA